MEAAKDMAMNATGANWARIVVARLRHAGQAVPGPRIDVERAASAAPQAEGHLVLRHVGRVFRPCRAVGLALGRHRSGRGDVVTVLAENRPEWAYVDLGAQCMGVIGNGIYPTSSPEQAEYILRDSRSRVAVVEDDEQLDKVLAMRANCPLLRAYHCP